MEIKPQCQTQSSFLDIKGYNIAFSKVSQRGWPDICYIGKYIVNGSHLAKTILLIREKAMRFKLPKEIRNEREIQKLGDRNQSNRMIVGRFRMVSLLWVELYQCMF